MKLKKKSIAVMILLFTSIFLWFTEATLKQYTKSDTLYISSAYNSDIILDDKIIMHLIYDESPCEIEVWSYRTSILDQFDGIGSVSVISQVTNHTALAVDSSTANRIKISKKLSKKLFNSKEIKGEQLFIDGEIYQVSGTSSNKDDKRVSMILGTDEYIISFSSSSLSVNRENWSIFISGTNKGIEREEFWLKSNGINIVNSTKYYAKLILKMISLVKITIQWSVICLVIYLFLIRIVDLIVGMLHKKAI